MGCKVKLLIILAIPILGGILIYRHITKVPPLEKIEEPWWGARSPESDDTKIHPFKINFTDIMVNDLKARLANARPLVHPLKNVHHNYGLNALFLHEAIGYWRRSYNFKKRQDFLNQFPQFLVNIQGLRIHYIHVKPNNPQNLPVYPLLLLHGWPGSIREFYEIIPYLTTPQTGRKIIFEVIVPSLPGYGFSEPAVIPGLGVTGMAVIFKNLMNRLGFEKYYIQGGDWGASIVQNMATLFPNQVAGVHSNMCVVNTPLANIKWILGAFYPPLVTSKRWEKKVYPLGEKFTYILLEFGYMHLQATKPDTLGAGLNDSPVGLAAYILEKFITWTNSAGKNEYDGGMPKKFTLDQLLDNVMIYWVSKSITTSMRLYAEEFSEGNAKTNLPITRNPILVPSACAKFEHEILHQPEAVLSEKYPNLVHLSEFDDGGHFAAFELPEILSSDIYTAVEKFIVASKNVIKIEL